MESEKRIAVPEIEYTSNGQVTKTKALILKAPATSHRKYTSIIRGVIFKAIRIYSERSNKEVQRKKKDDEQKEEEEISGKELLIMASTFNHDEIEKMTDTFFDLFCAGAVKLDEDTAMTKTLLDNLPESVFQIIMEEYLEAFFSGMLAVR